ncbi:38352_t:CDS:1, partial [Gigaspora margarita]
NQDPVSQTSNLIIIGTQVYRTNGDNVIPLSLLVKESLVPCDDILLFEDIEILAHVTENPNQIDHQKKTIFTKLEIIYLPDLI